MFNLQAQRDPLTLNIEQETVALPGCPISSDLPTITAHTTRVCPIILTASPVEVPFISDNIITTLQQWG